jgi:uncharacterized secreted protein with C-terminal beta-propeller domain
MARYSMFGMAGIGIAAAIGFVFALTSLGSTLGTPEFGGPDVFKNQTTDVQPATFAVAATQVMKKFTSADELANFLSSIELNRGQLSTTLNRPGASSDNFSLGLSSPDLNDGTREFAPIPPQSQGQALTETGKTAAPAYGGGASDDFSTTNVQVQGVDEPDFIKNDGKYAYILSGDRLTIVDAYPAQNASVATKVALDIQQGQYLQNMFLNNDTLVIFYQEYSQDYVIQEYDFAPQPVYQPKTHALVMDVSDRENPKVLDDYEVTGNYNNARMIGNHVYLVTVSDLYDYHHPVIPKVMESSRTVAMPPVYYFDNPELYYSFNTVTSIDIAPGAKNAVNSTAFLMNPASTLYVSEDSIYIAYQKNLPYYYYQTSTKDRFFTAVVPLLPSSIQQKIGDLDNDTALGASEKWDRVSELMQDTYNHMSEAEKNQLFEKIQQSLADYDLKIQKETQTTVIHKIAINPETGLIAYNSRGEVPGRLLNQFSMDEQGNRFRVATTSEFYSQYRGSMLDNNIYVLDEGMKIVGKLEGIAPNESIYSARFMDNRLYLVTFQRTDPFFVIDLSTDTPKVLGDLKLPGFSNYLHPYDDTHIIGIGKETKESQYGGVEVLGVKLALFDVSDVKNPKMVDAYEIGGRGTDSEVLYDHRALLFNKEKNVLSIPVSIVPDYTEPQLYDGGKYVQPKVWRGFYVFGVDPESGFTVKGKVEHFNDTNDYYYGYNTQGSRSFYIGNVLYTVTLNNMIKMNNLQDMDEINQLRLENTGGIIRYPVPLKGEPTIVSPSQQ